jgi:hypothetical protein
MPNVKQHARPRRGPASRRAVGLILATVGVVLGPPAARAVQLPPADTTRAAEGARIYLSWHAPYGQPSASDQLMSACGDSTSKDTLYLCIDTGDDAPKFQSFTATLYFWAAPGDSLDPHWLFGEGQQFHRLVVEYAPRDLPGVEPAWPASAYAASGYSTSKASGKLRMIAAGPDGQGWPLKGGQTYVAARLLVPRAPAKSRACERPVCIEWSLAMFGLGGGKLPEIHAGQRFVSWNSKGGKVCSTMRSFAAPTPWKPPKAAPPPGWKPPASHP